MIQGVVALIPKRLRTSSIPRKSEYLSFKNLDNTGDSLTLLLQQEQKDFFAKLIWPEKPADGVQLEICAFKKKM